MTYPILAPNHSWYKTSIARSTITQINIVDSYTPTGSETENWNADVDNNGAVKCYLNGTVLTIAGNGSGKIAMNEDSTYLFSYPAENENPIVNTFKNCVAINGLELLDSSNATTLKKCFFCLNKVTNLDGIKDWNISKVTNLQSTFSACLSLTELDLSQWDTSNVENMYYTFASHDSYGGDMALTTLNVSTWNTSKVTIMKCTFQLCSSLTSLDLTSWDVGSVTDMTCMFTYCKKLQTVGDISNWNTGACTNMSYMFNKCLELTSLDVSKWDVSKVTTFRCMFQGDTYGNPGLKIQNLDVSKWDTSSAIDMGFMFYGCKTGSVDVSKWDVSNVKDFDHMFAHSYLHIGDISGWKNSIVENFECTFHSVQNSVIDLSGFTDTSKCTSFGGMFKQYGSNLTKIIGLETFDTSSGLDFGDMFYGCEKLKELDLSNFDTTKAREGVVTSGNGTTSKVMENIFYQMYSLEKITLGEKFSYNGDGTTNSLVAVLPTPSTEHFAEANGYWYTNEGVAYSPSEAVKVVPITYYAVNPVLDRDYLAKGRTILNICNSIRKVSGDDSSVRYKLSELPEKIEGIKGLWEQIQDGTLTEWVDDEIIELTAPLFVNYLNLTKISCENLVGLCPLSFYGASNLTEIYLPNLQRLTGINSIGGHFGRCKKLETVTFPELISIQGNNTFQDCSNLTVVNFPKLVNLDYGTFDRCTRLTSVNLPAITRIDNNAPFSYCSSLISLRLPSLAELKNSLAYHCYSLKEIDLSALIKINYSGQVFNNCAALESLILRKSDAIVELSSAGVFNSKDGIGAGTAYIYVPAALIEEYKSATNWSTYAPQFRALEDYTVDGTITGELDETKVAEAAE